jgi:hypothetical protein
LVLQGLDQASFREAAWRLREVLFRLQTQQREKRPWIKTWEAFDGWRFLII